MRVRPRRVLLDLTCLGQPGLLPVVWRRRALVRRGYYRRGGCRVFLQRNHRHVYPRRRPPPYTRRLAECWILGLGLVLRLPVPCVRHEVDGTYRVRYHGPSRHLIVRLFGQGLLPPGGVRWYQRIPVVRPECPDGTSRRLVDGRQSDLFQSQYLLRYHDGLRSRLSTWRAGIHELSRRGSVQLTLLVHFWLRRVRQPRLPRQRHGCRHRRHPVRWLFVGLWHVASHFRKLAGRPTLGPASLRQLVLAWDRQCLLDLGRSRHRRTGLAWILPKPENPQVASRFCFHSYCILPELDLCHRCWTYLLGYC
mmetsp:Transcript_13968/g.33527  ORF Transcript_13968/g.33527 Transcript_13968/m.33527 type:complete len:307 (+) Transcript_13968:1086-2006(+)